MLPTDTTAAPITITLPPNLAASVRFLAHVYSKTPEAYAHELMAEGMSAVQEDSILGPQSKWKEWMLEGGAAEPAPMQEPATASASTPEAVPSAPEDKDVETLTIRLPGHLARVIRALAPGHDRTAEAWAAEGVARFVAVWIEDYSKEHANETSLPDELVALNMPIKEVRHD